MSAALADAGVSFSSRRLAKSDASDFPRAYAAFIAGVKIGWTASASTLKPVASSGSSLEIWVGEAYGDSKSVAW